MSGGLRPARERLIVFDPKQTNYDLFPRFGRRWHQDRMRCARCQRPSGRPRRGRAIESAARRIRRRRRCTYAGRQGGAHQRRRADDAGYRSLRGLGRRGAAECREPRLGFPRRGISAGFCACHHRSGNRSRGCCGRGSWGGADRGHRLFRLWAQCGGKNCARWRLRPVAGRRGQRV